MAATFEDYQEDVQSSTARTTARICVNNSNGVECTNNGTTCDKKICGGKLPTINECCSEESPVVDIEDLLGSPNEEDNTGYIRFIMFLNVC